MSWREERARAECTVKPTAANGARPTSSSYARIPALQQSTWVVDSGVSPDHHEKASVYLIIDPNSLTYICLLHLQTRPHLVGVAC